MSCYEYIYRKVYGMTLISLISETVVLMMECGARFCLHLRLIV